MSGALAVHIDYYGRRFPVGRLYLHNRAGKEAASLIYDPAWLENPLGYSLDPALPFSAGTFHTNPSQKIFGCLSDCSPDRWGRTLMQRLEARLAKAEKRRMRQLLERDYLLQVNDVARQGALRFTAQGADVFLAPPERGIPTLHVLRELLAAADTVSANTAADEDLRMLYQPGGSLGGARPKASVLGLGGELMIAKFPKPDDDWDIPLWEYVSLQLARVAGITTSEASLEKAGNRNILLIKRFDRTPDGGRIPFASAMTLLAAEDGDRRSYPEIGEILAADGAAPRDDWQELFRRVVFNILTSNFDDHLRNHGFLRTPDGWRLSPVYDLESTPNKAPVHSTFITEFDGTSSLDLAVEAAPDFGLSRKEAGEIVKNTANAVKKWRTVARQAGASARDIDLMRDAYERDDV